MFYGIFFFFSHQNAFWKAVELLCNSPVVFGNSTVQGLPNPTALRFPIAFDRSMAEMLIFFFSSPTAEQLQVPVSLFVIHFKKYGNNLTSVSKHICWPNVVICLKVNNKLTTLQDSDTQKIQAFCEEGGREIRKSELIDILGHAPMWIQRSDKM